MWKYHASEAIPIGYFSALGVPPTDGELAHLVNLKHHEA